MTLRSIILGLLCAAAISAATFFNDEVMKGTYLIGNFLPISIFGTFILVALLVNPLLARLSRRLVLSGRELATMVAISLFACYAPGRGLGHYFTTFLMLPHHHERTNPGWRGEPARLALETVLDWPTFARGLASGAALPETNLLRRTWERLPPGLRAQLGTAGESPLPPALQNDLLDAVNATLTDPALSVGIDPGVDAPPYLRLLARRPAADLRPEEIARRARGLLERALPGALKIRHPGVLENVPPRMLADAEHNSTMALDGFVTGLAQGDESISLRDIPWRAWTRTLLFWIPLLLTMCVAAIGLALVLHRQWSSHEHLPYPTVEFARSLLPAEGRVLSDIFRSRLFWIGTLLVLFIHMMNYANTWWPEYAIPVRTHFDFSPLLEIVPVFKKSNWGMLFRPTVYFTAVGFAYFLASDAALSLGLAPYVYALAVGTAAGYGVSFGGGHLRPTIESFLYAGAYTAMFLALAYSGRQYYRTAFARGLMLPVRDRIEPHAVWGARLAMLGIVLFVFQLCAVGVELPLALLYTLGVLMIFVVISRLLAEAGAFFVHAYFAPCALLWGFLGAMAIGREQLLVLAMVSSLLLIDPRETLMPFAVSSFQLVDRVKVKLGGAARWGVVALVLSLAVSIPSALYWQYQRGAITAGDWWTTQGVPKFAFNLNTEVARTLEAQGSLQISEHLHGLQRFAHIVPTPSLLIAFATTFSLVLLFTFLRHRLARWPLHPLMFLTLGTWQSASLGFSFLLGWVIKRLVTKYGGAGRYQALKPLMIGLVAGEVLAGVIPLIVGAVYYHVTGNPPKPFRILPG